MDEDYGTQVCAHPDCDKWLKVPLDYSGLVYCKKHYSPSHRNKRIIKENPKMKIPKTGSVSFCQYLNIKRHLNLEIFERRI